MLRHQGQSHLHHGSGLVQQGMHASVLHICVASFIYHMQLLTAPVAVQTATHSGPTCTARLLNLSYLLCVHRAPEQTDAEFGRRGSHTDLWGFATTVLQLPTGQLPYSGFTPMQIMGAMSRRRPPAVPETLPAWLQRVLQQCLSFDVSARPPVLQLLQASPPFSQRWFRREQAH